jgi:superfamily II DNA or RNA helicase
MLPLWPHQEYALRAIPEAVAAGHRRILLCTPTGGGKTRTIAEAIRGWLAEGLKTILYTNRVMLLEQLTRVLTEAGLPYGVRAAGWEEEQDPSALLQVSMTQTEAARVLRKQTHNVVPAKRIVVDEAHLQIGPKMAELMVKHLEDPEAVVVGLTATPIGMKDYYDHLIIAGTVSECRDCGALVPALHYGPDEPDWAEYRKLKKGKSPGETDDVSEAHARHLMMRPGVFGRVKEWFDVLNPDHRPTVLFAPGVNESLWFAEQFARAGVSAAHIDGDDVWIKGEWRHADREAREETLKASQSGDVVLLCNRYVLREGIDAPWLSHGIFATVFGSLQSYLQSGGRLLRSHPSLQAVTIQDHGGNWLRHGSLNADREWSIEYTASMHAGRRNDRIRERREREPAVCPKCKRIVTGRVCTCGNEMHIKSRSVVQSTGELRELRGDIFKPRSVCKQARGPEIWERMYFRSKTEKGARTFAAAFALFAQENYWQWPDLSWPLMPLDHDDRYRLVATVPMDRLRPKPLPHREG